MRWLICIGSLPCLRSALASCHELWISRTASRWNLRFYLLPYTKNALIKVSWIRRKLLTTFYFRWCGWQTDTVTRSCIQLLSTVPRFTWFSCTRQKSSWTCHCAFSWISSKVNEWQICFTLDERLWSGVRNNVNLCICFFRWCAKLTKSNCSYWILDKSQQSRTRGVFWYASRQPKGYWWIKYILNSILSSNLPLMLYWYSVFFRWKHILGSTVLFIYKCIYLFIYLFSHWPSQVCN